MLLSETENQFSSQLKSLEMGVNTLDSRVSQIDEKLNHVMQQNSEMMVRQGEEFRGLRTQLDDHRAELKKSIRQIRGGWTSQCQLIGFAIGLASWTLFMAWIMWA